MTTKQKILIVDDEQDVVRYLEMLLQDHGYETVSAKNGNEALDLMRGENPDLVTLDISMPEASGTRFYKTVRTDPELQDVPILIVTAVTGYAGDPYGYEKFISRSESVAPPDGFFPKPIDREAFVEKVEEVLAGRRAAASGS
jgi:CheY-like chemotaxis protein